MDALLSPRRFSPGRRFSARAFGVGALGGVVAYALLSGPGGLHLAIPPGPMLPPAETAALPTGPVAIPVSAWVTPAPARPAGAPPGPGHIAVEPPATAARGAHPAGAPEAAPAPAEAPAARGRDAAVIGPGPAEHGGEPADPAAPLPGTEAGDQFLTSLPPTGVLPLAFTLSARTAVQRVSVSASVPGPGGDPDGGTRGRIASGSVHTRWSTP